MSNTVTVTYVSRSYGVEWPTVIALIAVVVFVVLVIRAKRKD